VPSHIYYPVKPIWESLSPPRVSSHIYYPVKPIWESLSTPRVSSHIYYPVMRVTKLQNYSLCGKVSLPPYHPHSYPLLHSTTSTYKITILQPIWESLSTPRVPLHIYYPFNPVMRVTKLQNYTVWVLNTSHTRTELKSLHQDVDLLSTLKSAVTWYTHTSTASFFSQVLLFTSADSVSTPSR
jgi:hypothetical protein